jgi:tetratricopeptide (TPR) repeat protein
MDNLGALFERAAEDTKTGRLESAIDAYRRILRQSDLKSKAQHLAHWGIGEIHLNRKEYDKAELHLKKALELKPDEPIYHYLLGCTYRYVKNLEGALYHLQKAVDLDPSMAQYWGELGWVVGFNRDMAKGIEYLKKALSIDPASSHCLRDICVLYAKEYKWSEARVCIEEAVKHDPDNPDIRKVERDVAFFESEYKRMSVQSKKDGKTTEC